MNMVNLVIALLCLVASVVARPHFIAIPIEDIQFLNFNQNNGEGLIRIPRQIPNQDSDLSESRVARQSGGDGHDYVDYGAHTGHHGAFGWYADYPVHHHER